MTNRILIYEYALIFCSAHRSVIMAGRHVPMPTTLVKFYYVIYNVNKSILIEYMKFIILCPYKYKLHNILGIC